MFVIIHGDLIYVRFKGQVIGQSSRSQDGIMFLFGYECTTTVGPFQLQAPQSGTLSQISSGTQTSVQTVSDVCLKRNCSLDTGAFSALKVLDDNRAA